MFGLLESSILRRALLRLYVPNPTHARRPHCRRRTLAMSVPLD